MTNDSTKNFEVRVLQICAPANLVTGLFIYFYTVAVIQLDISLWGVAFVVAFSILGVFQLLGAPFSNILVSRKLSKKLQSWKNEVLSTQERTELLCEIQSFPKKKQIEAYLYFSLGTGILAFGYAHFLNVGWMDIVACVAVCIFCTHIAGVLNLFACIKLCSEYAKGLVEQGVEHKIIQERKTLGVNFLQSFFMLVMVPLIFTTIIFVLTYTINYLGNGNKITNMSMLLVCAVIVANIAASFIFTIIFFSTVLRSARILQESMEHITSNDIFTVEPTATDMANEISYNMYLANKIILLFQSILTKIRSIGQSLLPSINELQGIVDKTATSSCQQSSDVQEMLATIEENESQIKEIDRKVQDVTDINAVIARNIESSCVVLDKNIKKMEEIAQSNKTTLNGIWTLGEKINSVWDIVNSINDIAERTRIIGFNAELKVAETGATGSNFLIIANEIKRLANSTRDAVVLIQGRISEIQVSSDNLVISSEGGTERLREEVELSKKLASKLEEIRRSIDITQESMGDILLIIQQESLGIHWISQTVGKISSGIEEVSASMSTVTDITEQLKKTVYRLENLNKEIIQRDSCSLDEQKVQNSGVDTERSMDYEVK